MQNVVTSKALLCGRASRLAVLWVVITVVVCAVFVGGAFGEEFSVSNEDDLREAVANANANSEDDVIILTADVTLTTTLIISNGKITITDDGNNRYIIDDASSSLFQVNAGGELILTGTSSNSLTLDGQNKIMWSDGGAVYVNGGKFTMNDGVHITNFGWLGSDLGSLIGTAGVYVNSGEFTMTGGNITGCNGADGGGVYVGANGKFEMTGGLITQNGHNEVRGPFFGTLLLRETYGGGVLIEEGGEFTMSGDAKVKDNYGSPDIAGVVNDPDSGELDKQVNYTIHHYLQRLDLSGYDVVFTETIYGSNVGEETNAVARLFPGYQPQPITQITLKKDVENSVAIYYDYNPTYLIMIPDSLNLSDESPSATIQITASDMWLLETGWVNVTVSSEHNFNLEHISYPAPLVSYTLTRDGDTNALTNGEIVATFSMAEYLSLAESQRKPTETLRATVTGEASVTGTYQDLLTFTVSPNYGVTT